MAMQVALLRGVNVSRQRRVPMAELRGAMVAAGFANVRNYVASGNILFTAQGPTEAAEAALEGLIADRFGFACDVIVRDAAALAAHRAANPLPQAASERPKMLHILLAKRPIVADSAEAFAECAQAGEMVRASEGALWIDYAGGVGRSQLTPARINRIVGSPVTARNWTTLTTLVAMAGA